MATSGARLRLLAGSSEQDFCSGAVLVKLGTAFSGAGKAR
jgi:hypothetical protein